jgi:hypothetical protein
MDLATLLSIKNNKECLELPKNFIGKVSHKKIKIVRKNKICLNDNINKLTLLLNKLTNDNINYIVCDFLKSIKINNNEDYISIINCIYDKMIMDNNNIDIYVKFLSYIFDINTIKYQYSNEFLFDKLNNINNNHIKIITYMININILNNIVDDLYSYLVNNKHYEQLYIFITNYNKKIDNDININDIDINDINDIRIKLMFQVLLDNNIDGSSIDNNITSPINEPINNNNLIDLVNNLVEEYLIMDNIDDIKYVFDDLNNNDKVIFKKHLLLKAKNNKIKKLYNKL